MLADDFLERRKWSMRNLLAATCVSLVLITTLGCGSGPSVEIPDEPVPMPETGPETAGSSLPASGPPTQP